MSTKRRLRLWLLRMSGWLLRRWLPDPVSPGKVGRVLVIRPDHLGDVLLSRPAIDALAHALPEAEIVVAVGPWGRPALGAQPRRRLLICPFPGFSRVRQGPLQPYLLLWRYTAMLRGKGPFDLAVLLRPDHWWGALLVRLAGIPLRVGYATPETTPFLTTALPYAPGRHSTEDALMLAAAAAAAVGRAVASPDTGQCLPSAAVPQDHARVDALLAALHLLGRPLLVLHPAAGSPLKSWPPQRFAAVGGALAASLQAKVLVTGSATEAPMTQSICELLPGAVNLAGRLSWGELEALLGRAALVIGVDSGPLHLAVAAGTPSVALFGPADPLQFAPWGPSDRHRVVYAGLPCRPCRRLDSCSLEPDLVGPPACMRAITEEMVIQLGFAAMARGRSGAATLH